MYACVHVPSGRGQQRTRTGPFARTPTALPELDYLDPPYSPRPIASFASDRDSLPYCPVIGQFHSLRLSRFHFLPFPPRSPPLSIRYFQYRRPSTLLMRFRARGDGYVDRRIVRA